MPGQGGERAFVIGVEQALGLEFLFQRFERRGQRSGTGGLHVLDNQLVVAAGLIEAQFRPHLNLLSGLGAEAQACIGAAEHGAADLGAIVLEREIPVAGRGARQVGQFPLHPQRGIVPLQQALDRAVELADAERLAVLFRPRGPRCQRRGCLSVLGHGVIVAICGFVTSGVRVAPSGAYRLWEYAQSLKIRSLRSRRLGSPGPPALCHRSQRP